MKLWKLVKHFWEYIRFSFEYRSFTISQFSEKSKGKNLSLCREWRGAHGYLADRYV
jgi:hypothetical protein